VNALPFLTGLALLFWGWEVGLLPVAAVGAVLLELARWVRWHWEFSESDMNRVWDVCGVLFVGAAIYSYVSTDMVTGPMRFMQWLPMVFFPFVVAVVYSARDSVRQSTYFLILRRGRDSKRALGQYVPYWYIIVCCASASMVNARDVRFYVGVVLVGVWLLWASRNRNIPAWAWAMVLVVVIAGGFAGHVGLNQLQSVVENKAGELFEKFNTPDIELSQTRTAIGSVGKLKQSNRIVLRVTSANPPSVLRKASFDSYISAGNHASWAASDGKFTDILPATESSWRFGEQRPPSSVATISTYVTHGIGILPAPNGPLAIDGLLAGSLETNRCGSIRAHDTPPLIRYTVTGGDRSTLDAPPGPADLAVPRNELPAVAQIATELELAGKSPAESMLRVGNFFQQKFSYTLYLKSHKAPLQHFLLEGRTGHCEYFATATTLLLRQAGIPARYAIGYAVPEEADSDDVHLVRDRHAHAWVLAYVNGTWHDFDTTPGSWEAMEEENRPRMQWLTDFFGALRYYFTSWRYYGDRNALAKWLLMILPVVLVWFIWRLVSKNRRINRQIVRSKPAAAKHAGTDSEFYRIEKHLAGAGIPRRADEPLAAWLLRLERAGIPSLQTIVALHNAYRFDPLGLAPEQRRELAAEVEKWLAATR